MDVTFVGNPLMHHLLLGIDPEKLVRTGRRSETARVLSGFLETQAVN